MQSEIVQHDKVVDRDVGALVSAKPPRISDVSMSKISYPLKASVQSYIQSRVCTKKVANVAKTYFPDDVIEFAISGNCFWNHLGSWLELQMKICSIDGTAITNVATSGSFARPDYITALATATDSDPYVNLCGSIQRLFANVSLKANHSLIEANEDPAMTGILLTNCTFSNEDRYLSNRFAGFAPYYENTYANHVKTIENSDIKALAAAGTQASFETASRYLSQLVNVTTDGKTVTAVNPIGVGTATMADSKTDGLTVVNNCNLYVRPFVDYYAGVEKSWCDGTYHRFILPLPYLGLGIFQTQH